MLHGRLEGQICPCEDIIEPTITTMNINPGCSSLDVVDIDAKGTQDRGVSKIPFAKYRQMVVKAYLRADFAPI